MNAFMDEKAELFQRHDFLMRCSEGFKFDTEEICKNAGSPTQQNLPLGQLVVFSDYCTHHRLKGTWATNEQVLAVPKVYGVCLRVFAKERQAMQGALQTFSPLTPGNEKDKNCQEISMFCDDFHYEALIPDDLYEGYDSRATKYHVSHTQQRDAKKNHGYHHRKRERSAIDYDPSQSEVGSKQMLSEKIQALIEKTEADMDIDVEDRNETLAELHGMLWELVSSA
jgi:hypothetical protein